MSSILVCFLTVLLLADAWKLFNPILIKKKKFNLLDSSLFVIKENNNYDDNNGKPLQSLREGKWIKFICGASNQDLPMIRNLCYIYTLAGVDCIDISADNAVLLAATSGINAALSTGK
jgi:hypothetical protein